MTVPDTTADHPRPWPAIPPVDLDLVRRTERFFDGASLTKPGVQVEAVIPVHWGVDQGLVAVHSDGSVATRPLGEHPAPELLNLSAARSLFAEGLDYRSVPTAEPTTQSIERGFLEMGRQVPPVVRALNARQAALTGEQEVVDRFTAEVMGLWSGWREPVATALLGNWADPLNGGGELSPAALAELRSEAGTIHRQLTPIWRRKTSRARLLLLDTPLGNNSTLYDLLAAAPAPDDPADTLEDERLLLILRDLHPAERQVVLALAHPGVTTWKDAAAFAGATTAFGERVRRKVRKLAGPRRSVPATGSEK
ncbi:hypothetical protein [Kitasatospora sp. NPDC101183]|uniref:hypothetical protein n=1 Tax=Kitasatospora sp. NPDC101183 TaxID=3364100 RepID=UPI00382C2F5B